MTEADASQRQKRRVSARSPDGRWATPTPPPPFSEDAEQAVIAAMLMDAGAVVRARGMLDGSMFFLDRHRRIFRAMVALSERGDAVDPLTLAEELASRGELDAAGGKDYIGWLIDVVPTAAHIDHHAAIVREKAARRTLIERAEGALALARDSARPMLDAVAELRGTLDSLAGPSARDGLPAPVCALDAVTEPVEWLIEGLITRGDLCLFAGVGGAGKTTAAMHLAGAIAGGYPAFDHFATHATPVLIVSEEDSASILINRLGALVRGHEWDPARVMANVHIFALRGIRLSDERWRAHLAETMRRLHIGLLLLDPWRALHDGAENDSDSTSAALRAVRDIAGDTGATPLVSHHLTKPAEGRGGRDRVRGSTALLDASRCAYLLEERDDGIGVECIKLSRAPRPRPFVIGRTVEAAEENPAIWRSARLSFVTAKVAALTTAQRFVLERIDESAGSLTSTALRAAARGSGQSNNDVSEAIRTLHESGRITFEDGAHGAKLWRRSTLPNALGKVDETTLPTLPAPCPAGSPGSWSSMPRMPRSRRMAMA